MLALTERSTDADRGSAFALYSACFAGSIALGSIGTAPLIGILGFETLLALSMVTLGVSAAVAYADRGMHQPVGDARRRADGAGHPAEGTPAGK